MHEREALTLYFFYHNRENLLLLGLILGQEDESCAVFSFFGHRYTLQENELMRYLQQNAGSVSCLIVGALSSAVAHVLKYFQCIVNQLVAFVAVNVHHHSDAASIMFVG